VGCVRQGEEPAGADKAADQRSDGSDVVGVHIVEASGRRRRASDTDKVIVAMGGQTFKSPDGFVMTMDAKNHHLHKPVMIGEVKSDGQFNVVWKTSAPIRAQPWSPYIPGNEKKKDGPEAM
jgi:urea transport system substrate-binding protein